MSSVYIICNGGKRETDMPPAFSVPIACWELVQRIPLCGKLFRSLLTHGPYNGASFVGFHGRRGACITISGNGSLILRQRCF
jgi:hypothetical protein